MDCNPYCDLTFPHLLQNIYKTGFTLYRLSFQVRNIIENKSNTSCDCSGPQVMEHGPNSKSDISSKTESPILSLTEYYVLYRAINLWNGPKYVPYNTKEARLRSFIFHNWPMS